MMRRGYCDSLRIEGYNNMWAPVYYREDASSCPPVPVYPR